MRTEFPLDGYLLKQRHPELWLHARTHPELEPGCRWLLAFVKLSSHVLRTSLETMDGISESFGFCQVSELREETKNEGHTTNSGVTDHVSVNAPAAKNLYLQQGEFPVSCESCCALCSLHKKLQKSFLREKFWWRTEIVEQGCHLSSSVRSASDMRDRLAGRLRVQSCPPSSQLLTRFDPPWDQLKKNLVWL